MLIPEDLELQYDENVNNGANFTMAGRVMWVMKFGAVESSIQCFFVRELLYVCVYIVEAEEK